MLTGSGKYLVGYLSSLSEVYEDDLFRFKADDLGNLLVLIIKKNRLTRR
jgi:hypothetical protein